jgi:hypothetical protein
MISNAAYIQKLNKSQNVVKKISAEMLAQFIIGMVPFSDQRHNFKKCN